MEIIGHSGAKGLAPANTLASISKAIEFRVDAVEIDVRVTSDHVPILWHSAKLVDPSGAKLKVSKYRYADLKQHKADLATLEEALTMLKGKSKLIVEIKHGSEVEPIVKVLKNALDSDWASRDLFVSSFFLSILKDLKQQMPSLNLIVCDQWSGVRATQRAELVNTKRLIMNRRWLWSGFVRFLSLQGYEITAYSVNDAKTAQALAKMGVKAIITDYPDRFMKK